MDSLLKEANKSRDVKKDIKRLKSARKYLISYQEFIHSLEEK